MKTFEAFIKTAKTSATFISRYLDPAGDWVPIVIFETPNGHTHMIEAPALSEGIESARRIARHVRQQDAITVAVVHMIWILDGVDQEYVDAYEEGDRPAVAEDPNRKEALSVFAFDREGNVASSVAEITRRDAKSPLLEEWDDSGTPSGPFTDAFKWAVGAIK